MVWTLHPKQLRHILLTCYTLMWPCDEVKALIQTKDSMAKALMEKALMGKASMERASTEEFTTCTREMEKVIAKADHSQRWRQS